MKYFVSCSFGKDSVATALLALEKGEPIDGLIFCEVMYDHSRNISGEIPEHINWIRNTAIPRLEEMGLKTTIVKGTKDYLYFFKNTVGGGVCRQALRFSAGWEMHYKPGLQSTPNRKIFARTERGNNQLRRYRNRRTRTPGPIKAWLRVFACKV